MKFHYRNSSTCNFVQFQIIREEKKSNLILDREDNTAVHEIAFYMNKTGLLSFHFVQFQIIREKKNSNRIFYRNYD